MQTEHPRSPHLRQPLTGSATDRLPTVAYFAAHLRQPLTGSAAELRQSISLQQTPGRPLTAARGFLVHLPRSPIVQQGFALLCPRPGVSTFIVSEYVAVTFGGGGVASGTAPRLLSACALPRYSACALPCCLSLDFVSAHPHCYVSRRAQHGRRRAQRISSRWWCCLASCCARLSPASRRRGGVPVR